MDKYKELLILERFAHLATGTFGKLVLPTGEVFFTCEQPWENNKTFVSCIPEGIYRMGLRMSPTVQRITDGAYSSGWEVQDVIGRSYIMLHPGNYPRHVEGCIAVGMGTGSHAKEGPDQHYITESQVAFRKLMSALQYRDTWFLKIASATSSL